MTLKNKDVMGLYEGLKEISEDTSRDFNIKLCYIFAKNKYILEPIYYAVLESRDKLLLKYGKQEEGQITIKKENINDFSKEYEVFLDMDNYIELKEISLEDLGSEKISIQLMGKLLPIIKKDAE